MGLRRSPAVLSSTAAKVGVGLGPSSPTPVVAKMLRTLRDRALANKDIQQAVEDMSEAAGVDDDDVRGWVESVIGSALPRSASTSRIASTTSSSYTARAAPARRWRWTSARSWASRSSRARATSSSARSRARALRTRRRASVPASRSSSAGRCSRSARRRPASRPWPTASAPPTRGRREITLGRPTPDDAGARALYSCVCCSFRIFTVLGRGRVPWGEKLVRP